MGSAWNRLTERLLDAELTVAGYRLALAIARYTIGYPKNDNRVGQKLLRELAQMDGRTFERALDELQEKGLLHHEPGKRGPGNRGLYELMLDPNEKAAPARPKAERKRGRTAGAKTAASKSTENTLQTRVIDAYRAGGGSLELAEWRGAIVRQAKTLSKRGTDEVLIVDAARALGRERTFPGYLPQKVEELERSGGLCRWEGLDQSKLTDAQLAECDCRTCEEWRAYRVERAVPSA